MTSPRSENKAYNQTFVSLWPGRLTNKRRFKTNHQTETKEERANASQNNFSFENGSDT